MGSLGAVTVGFARREQMGSLGAQPNGFARRATKWVRSAHSQMGSLGARTNGFVRRADRWVDLKIPPSGGEPGVESFDVIALMAEHFMDDGATFLKVMTVALKVSIQPPNPCIH
jgi:hypothetical protein